MGRERFKWNNLIVLSVAIVLVVFITIVASILHKTDKTVFTIDEYEVTDDEFNHILQNMKALTVNYFKEKYNVDYSKNFWKSSYGGKNPSEYAKQEAMDYLLKIKTEQIIMKENGIIEDLSYEAINKHLKAENERRKKELENKRPIYGPVQYNITEYYSYHQNINRQALVEKWAKNFGHTLSDEFLEGYYGEIKDHYFKKADSVIYEKIAVKSEPNGMEILEEFKKKASIAKLTTDEATQSMDRFITVERKFIDPKEIKKEASIENELYEAFLELNEGDFTEIYQMDNEDVMFRMIEKQHNGYEHYSDVKNTVVKIYAQEQLDKRVSQRLKNVSVKINDPIYDKIIVD
jgi:hypothetical protein